VTTPQAFADLIRRAPSLVLLVALKGVESVAGAVRIHHAEARGRRRPHVLRAAERRIEELGGAQALQAWPLLAVTGRPVDAEERAWEQRRL
jgi:hypothetical protein